MFDVDAVKARLTTFGYEVKESDEGGIKFSVDKVTNLIKNETNCSTVPEGLEQVAVDMVCSEFFLMKKTFAPDDLNNIDLSYAVKQIQAGDTNTVFAIGEGNATPEQRLNTFIDYLGSYGKSQFSAFRRLRW